jgi:secreted PhoX family phosphatase
MSDRIKPGSNALTASRRDFLRRAFHGLGLVVVGPSIINCSDGDGAFDFSNVPQTSNIANVGPLLAPDANGLRLPAGFTSRIVAHSGELVAGTDYMWHGSPDGGATFPLTDGGYIYVSNSEALLLGDGGAGAIRFDKNGAIVDAYRILDGTGHNCAGGPTPWGTWMSCEEHSSGLVHECDPHGVDAAITWPALGAFSHEAITFDTELRAYLTEDLPDGRLYRFTPASISGGKPDLSSGTLEAMRVVTGMEGPVVWETIASPSNVPTPTRQQAPTSTAFNGGEGIWFRDGEVFFATKGDNRVWSYSVTDQMLTIIYDAGAMVAPILTGVDNIVVSAGGDVIVAEDGGDMQVVAITPDGAVVPLMQIMGQPASEVTGVALDPHRKRLYFSSQRGEPANLTTGGITYEVTGPFFI